MTVTITVPVPPAACWPNVRSHWAKKARAVKGCRTIAHLYALAACNTRPMWKSARVTIRVTYADKRRRDPDNLIAALKSTIDGLRDAGIIADDDRLVIMPVEVAEPSRKNAGVSITVAPEDP